jgi:shikimate dehydrogenase
MPHKVTTVALLDEVSLAVKIAGSCNAILRRDDGSLYGDMFDGEGFTRGAKHRGFDFAGTDCLVVGAGGVGSAIAAAIAAQRPRSLAICDPRRDAVESLVGRLRRYYPDLAVEIRTSDPAGYHLVVNATPLGMRPDDPLPFDPERLDSQAFVGEVVLSAEMTPLLRAAASRGCRYQIGTDMLFEQIPAYLEFFGYGATTPDELRETARIAYSPQTVGHQIGT